MSTERRNCKLANLWVKEKKSGSNQDLTDGSLKSLKTVDVQNYLLLYIWIVLPSNRNIYKWEIRYVMLCNYVQVSYEGWISNTQYVRG